MVNHKSLKIPFCTYLSYTIDIFHIKKLHRALVLGQLVFKVRPILGGSGGSKFGFRGRTQGSGSSKFGFGWRTLIKRQIFFRLLAQGSEFKFGAVFACLGIYEGSGGSKFGC